jgi:hypothetical protein
MKSKADMAKYGNRIPSLQRMWENFGMRPGAVYNIEMRNGNWTSHFIYAHRIPKTGGGVKEAVSSSSIRIYSAPSATTKRHYSRSWGPAFLHVSALQRQGLV